MGNKTAWARLARTRSEVLLVAGFGTFWAFFDSCFYGLTLARSQAAFGFSLQTTQLIGLFTSVLVAVLVVAVPAVRRSITRPVDVGVLSAGAILFLTAGVHAAEKWPAASVAMFGLSSLSIGLVMFSWVGLYARPSVHGPGVLVAGSIAAGGILEFLIAMLQPQFTLAAIWVLPLAGAALYAAAVRESGRAEGGGAPGQPAQQAATSPYDAPNATTTPRSAGALADLGLSRRFIVALIVFSLAVGVMQFLTPVTTQAPSDQGTQLRLAARYSVALVIFIGAALLRWRPAAMYRVGALVVIGGFLVLPFLPPQVYYVGSVIANAGYTCVELMVWTVVFESARSRGIEAVAPIGITRLLMGAGAFAGVIFNLTVSQLAPSPSLMEALNSLIVYAIVIATVLVLDSNAGSQSWYLIERSFSKAPQAPSFSATCHHMAQEAGLTQREAEVFVLLASGRTAPYIANELGIATSTVNFHVRHVYEKFAVNTKQDLIDLVTHRQENPSS